MDNVPGNHSPWWKKLGWLILIWMCSVAALGLLAYLIRVLMNSVGLTT